MAGCATSSNTYDSLDACKLTKPPKESKVKNAGHLGQSFTYPTVVTEGYSGCRKVWLTDYNSSDTYELQAIIKYEHGVIYEVELFDEEKKQKEVCKFDKNKTILAGSPEHCSSYEVYENW